MNENQRNAMIARIDERTAMIIDRLDRVAAHQESHEDKDSKRIAALHERIDRLNKFGVSIAIVAGGVGTGAAWLWNKITG